jgi:dCTP deaminase
MILADREIHLALANRQIEITPPPAEEAFSSTGIDLTLDAPGEIWRPPPGRPIRPGAADHGYAGLAECKDRIASLDGYPLQPAAFLLAWTRETVALPITSRLAARIEGKSNLARLGLAVQLAATTIQAGFRGQIPLEIVNFAAREIILDVGMPICRLVFEITFGTPTKAASAGLPPR